MSFIKLENVCLDYIIKTGSNSIRKATFHLAKKIVKQSPTNTSIKNSSYRALNNINLEINKGDRVGFLGRNGAGKSTILKVFAKIYKPNLGTISVQGKIANLFDVNLGMNGEATGYENIINLGIMRGLSNKEATEIIEDVEQFTELGTFLNHPVCTYSAGMQIKLAFGVITAIPPEIILIDEIIGAGDIHFMEKATARLENMIESSHILALSSHSNDIIKRFCNKVVVLDKGEIQFMGNTQSGIDFYHEHATK